MTTKTTWYRRTGDRRGRLRFEIVGQAWGKLEHLEPSRGQAAGGDSVQIRDLSLSGALLSTSRAVPPGHRARLRTVLGRDPLAVEVEVRHARAEGPHESGRANGRCLVGVTFVSLDRQGERCVQSVLGGTSS